MKTCIFALALAGILLGCDTKEKARLEFKLDSLSYIVAESKSKDLVLTEIGVILDSIDMNRHALQLRIVEGVSYAEYVERINRINTYVKDSQAKFASLENNLKSSKSISSTTIRRLKTEIDLKSQEIVALQLEVIKFREQNGNMAASISEKDSTISSQKEMIRIKRNEVATLQELVADISDLNRMKVAGLYFAQAQAVETAANRTKFAPHKKRETLREALELYRLSYSLGNEAAQVKIQELEKKVS